MRRSAIGYPAKEYEILPNLSEVQSTAYTRTKLGSTVSRGSQETAKVSLVKQTI